VSPETETRAPAKGATDAEAREVLALLSTVIQGFKSHGKGREKPDEMTKLFESGELGERHVNPLLVLTLEGPLSVSELAGRIGLTLGTTSLLVGELSRAGLAERREDDADRRRTIVSIGDEQLKVMKPMVQETLAPLRRALDRMKPAERRHFVEGLGILAEETGGSAGPVENC
jgi:DNA-binding MarR family transcriptional regulator